MRRSGVIRIPGKAAPASFLRKFPLLPEIAAFWQKIQPMLQPEKNTAPEPFSPVRQGSSHARRAARPA